MEDLAGTAVRVTPERHQADEWAVVLAAGNIPHRLHPGLDGWALIVAARDAEAAREALDAPLLAGAGGNALTARPAGPPHASRRASDFSFASRGTCSALRLWIRGRGPAGSTAGLGASGRLGSLEYARPSPSGRLSAPE